MKNNTKEVYLTWDEWYELACDYYQEHGDLLVRQDYKVYAELKRENGEIISGNFALGNWISNQRKAYKNRICNNNTIPYKNLSPLNDKKVQKLESIGMEWDASWNSRAILTWDEWYKLACDYYQEHGNLLIQEYYKVYAEFTRNNGEFINGVFKLGVWIVYQRGKKEKLSNKQKLMLDKIEMVWDARYLRTLPIKIKGEKNWQQMYKKAVQYHTIYGTINIPKSIDNKYGEWIKTQKKRYILRKSKNKSIRRYLPLAGQKNLKLELYGIIWNCVENKKNVKYFCNAWHISYNRVKNMSYHELLWRVKYLLNNGYTVENNKEFFYMNDIEMYENYGCTRLDLLKTVVKPSEKKYKIKSIK